MMNHIDMSGEEDPSLPTSRESAVPTLVSLCRTVICTYMEQYTPESFGICDLDEWEHLIRWRWRMTQPKQRSSQTHTRKAVLAAPILLALEEANPHLQDSLTADQLLWQDCVELGFPRDGSTRPLELLVPWPVLVQRLRMVPTTLDDDSDAEQLLALCHSTTWNVALLRDTGLGKIVQRYVKKTKPILEEVPHRAGLQEVLDAWRELAAATDPDAVYLPNQTQHRRPGVAEDLRRAERAMTWRQLFLILQERKAQRQAAQGERMRNIRETVCVCCAVLFIIHDLFHVTYSYISLSLTFIYFHVGSWRRIVPNWSRSVRRYPHPPNPFFLRHLPPTIA